MTPEELEEFNAWVKRGAKTEITVSRSSGDDGTVWLVLGVIGGLGVLVFAALAMREVNGIQAGVNALDANNKAMRQSLEEETDRLIEQERRSGKPFQFENPENAKWWEEEKRNRGNRP